jgi:RecA-family ATPase
VEIPEDFNAPPPPEDQQGDPAQFAPPFSSAKIIAHPSSVYPDLIEKILPAGSINILSGGSGVGKTAFIADWCARFRDGRSICWKPTRIPTGGIGVITADRKWSSHRQWFDAVGFSDIPHVSLRDDPTFNWESLNNKSVLPQILETCIRRLGLGRDALIVVDPISMFVHGNLLDYKQTAIALARLDKVCTSLGVTVIGIAHTAKQKGEAKDR